MTCLVILREVAGSTLANHVATGVDSATPRGMTCLKKEATISPN
jgi:hypothetical protein